VVWAMMSPGGSIVASLENVNGFLVVYTPSDDLIRTYFKQKGVIPEKCVPRSLMMARGGSKFRKERFKEFPNNSSVVGGERFRFDPFRQVVDGYDKLWANRIRSQNLLGIVVWAMRSPGGSTVASLENVNGFLAVYTPSDDLICIDFEQKGVVPEEENPTEQSRLGIFLSKEIIEGRMIRIHNAFVHDEGIFLKKTGHQPGYLQKVLYESLIETGITEKTTDTLDDRLRSINGSNNGLNDGSNNRLRVLYWSFNLDNQRLDVFGASVISRRHCVLCHLGLTFHYFMRRRRVMVLLGRVPEPEDELTEKALIDVYEGELTLRIGKEAVTFNLDQTSRYSANYDAMSVNRIDLIDVACEEYSQEVLGFFVSGNPTPSTKPIVSNSSPTLTPFGDSDFLLEETDAFLAIDDEPISSKINGSYYDSEGDILLLENLYPPLDNPELTIRRRSRIDPTLLNNSEMAAEGNGDLPVPNLRTMEELCRRLKSRMTLFNKSRILANFMACRCISTRSSARNLFSPLDNPELTIRRRYHVDPTLLNDFEMATDGNGDPSVSDLRTMEELCQPTLNGRGGPVVSIAIQVTDFRLKNDMIQQVQNSCQFYGLSGDDANKHLDKFLHVAQSIKVNGVIDDALRLYLFPHSLTHHATAWFDRLPRNSINTFEQMAKIFHGKYFPPSMVTKLKNEITNFHQLMVLLGRVPEPEDELWWSQLVVEESGLDKPELGNPGLDKLDAGFDHD
nr:reverse transcriptase domain-containing protein [Tanacetum cinerariifolium]